MISFLISATFVLVFLFIVCLLASCMFWVVMKVFRSLFPNRFSVCEKRQKDER